MMIVDSALLNRDSGPYFYNAKIMITDHIWAANIEMHVKSFDCYRYGHCQDKAYENVIPHMVWVFENW